MAYRYGQNRQQMVLFPERLDQYVAAEHPVRAFDAFVDALDFNELGIELNSRKVGNSQYDPRLMLKLLLYGYSYGVKSSRKLERELHHNLAFMWLMKGLKPDHKTIAEFRRQNKKALKNALRLCARLCLKLGLIEGNIFFVDSTKIRANAGSANDHNVRWYREKLKQINARIKELLDECEQLDASEADQGSLVSMPAELAKAQNLRASIENALQEMTKRGSRTKNGKQRKINRIDPESARMSSRQGTHPSYAMQTVVEDKNALIIHSDAVSEGNDSNQLEQQISAAEDNLQRDCRIAAADSGYANIEQINKLESKNRTVLVPSQVKAAHNAASPFEKQAFTYEPKQDCYYCPGGHRLTFYQIREKVWRRYRIEDPQLCRACAHFGSCTRSKQGRTVMRHKLESLREQVDHRLDQPELKKIYDRRKARVEHPFGYVKKLIGFGQFSMRGRLAAQAEASLVSTCFNLTRMITLLGGVHGLVSKLQTV